MRRAMGKKKREEMAVHRGEVHQRRGGARHQEGKGGEDIFTDGHSFLTTVSPQPQRGLRLSGLSDCLSEGPFPGAFLRGGAFE